MKNSEIHILAQSDNNYLAGLYTTLTSVVVENNLKDRFVFHVIDAGIHSEEKIKLESFFKKFGNVRLEFHTVDLSVFQGAKTMRGSLAPYSRLYMGQIVDAPRCIYIDVDILVGRDVRELWEMEMNDNIFWAKQEDHNFSEGKPSFLPRDCIFEPMENVAHYKYFNSGFLLCDIEAYRNAHVFEQAVNLIQTHGDRHRIESKTCDQGLINYICRGKIGELAPEWNMPEAIVPLTENTNYHYLSPKKPWNAAKFFPSDKLWLLFYKTFIQSDFRYQLSWKAKMHHLAFHLRNLLMGIAPDTLSAIVQKLHPKRPYVYHMKRRGYHYYRDNLLRGGLDPVSREVYLCKEKQWKAFAARLPAEFHN